MEPILNIFPFQNPYSKIVHPTSEYLEHISNSPFSKAYPFVKTIFENLF